MNAKSTRRSFLQTSALAGIAMPTISPGSALGKNGKVAPSNRLVMGGIGIGLVVVKYFLVFKQKDIQFVTIADAQADGDRAASSTDYEWTAPRRGYVRSTGEGYRLRKSHR